MRLLAGFVDEVRPFLEAELAHRADKQKSEAKGINIQFERIEVLFLRMSYVPQKLRRGVLDSGQVNEYLLAVHLHCILEVTEKVLVLMD